MYQTIADMVTDFDAFEATQICSPATTPFSAAAITSYAYIPSSGKRDEAEVRGPRRWFQSEDIF